jgi:hypothetical protein
MGPEGKYRGSWSAKYVQCFKLGTRNFILLFLSFFCVCVCDWVHETEEEGRREEGGGM